MPLIFKALLNIGIGLILQWIAFMLSDPPPDAEAGTQSDLDFPKVREGTDAGIVFGCVWRDSTSMFHHWSGDFNTREIRNTMGKKG